MRSGMMFGALLAFACGAALCSSALAGSLSPPAGPIQATDRTRLDAQQITLPHTINQPGSYVLTSNFVATNNFSGFRIDSDNVTLDLNGFTIDGAGIGANGIEVVGAYQNITVFNGVLTNWTLDGVNAAIARNCRFTDLHVSKATSNGYTIDSGNVFTRCTALDCGVNGFEGIESNSYLQCIADDNGQSGFSTGLSSTLQDCVASNNLGAGFVADNGSAIFNCTALRNPGTGIIVGNGSVVSRCVVRDCGDGISAFAQTLIEDNVIHICQSRGIRVLFDTCRVVNNHITDCTTGIEISSANGGTFVSNNLVLNNATNYSFTQGNHLELILGQLPEIIQWPAQVKLVGSLTAPAVGDGITVAANDVTIDLNGFALVGVPGGLGTGISVGPVSNLTVKNGTIRDWDNFGINANASPNGHFSDLTLVANQGEGLSTGPGSIAERCIAQGNGIGLHAFAGSTMSNCTSQDNNGDGLVVDDHSRAEDCISRNNGGNGIALLFGSTASRCTVQQNQGNGFFADFNCIVRECHVRENGFAGITCLDLNTISDNRLADNGFAIALSIGIEVAGGGNRVDGNDLKNHGENIQALGLGSTFYNNSATGGAPNYNLAAGNDFGPIAPAAAALPMSNVEY